MYCQQLLSVVKLGGVCVPFKHKVKACTCSETYICIGYVLPTIVDVHLYWIYSANNCRVLFSWGLSVCPSGTRLGHLHVLRYIFVLDMFCQQLWGVVDISRIYQGEGGGWGVGKSSIVPNILYPKHPNAT